MAELDGSHEQQQDTGGEITKQEPCAKRGMDPVTLIAGIATMLVSAYVLSDGVSMFPGFDPRWVLAGGAVLIGVLMLGASMRGGPK